MINILLKTLLANLEVEYGYSGIIIDNKDLFRKIYYTPLEELIISKNSEEISSSKINIIKNILDFDLNEKKCIADLYKYMDKNVTINYKEEKTELFSVISKFLDFILDNETSNLEYAIEIDFNKLLQAIDLKYVVSENIIENIVNYLKNTASKNLITLTYNLNNYLTEEEIVLLNSELEKNQIILLDISSLASNKLTKLIIDKDLCII